MSFIEDMQTRAKVEGERLKSANSSFQNKREMMKKFNKVVKDANTAINKVSDPQKRDEFINKGREELKKMEADHPFIGKSREKIAEKFNTVRDESVKEHTFHVEADLFNGLSVIEGVDERLSYVEDFIVKDSHSRFRKHVYEDNMADNDFVFRAVKKALNETSISDVHLRSLFNIAELNAMQFIEKYKAQESDFFTGLFFANLRTAVLIHLSI